MLLVVVSDSGVCPACTLRSATSYNRYITCPPPPGPSTDRPSSVRPSVGVCGWSWKGGQGGEFSHVVLAGDARAALQQHVHALLVVVGGRQMQCTVASLALRLLRRHHPAPALPRPRLM